MATPIPSPAQHLACHQRNEPPPYDAFEERFGEVTVPVRISRHLVGRGRRGSWGLSWGSSSLSIKARVQGPDGGAARSKVVHKLDSETTVRVEVTFKPHAEGAYRIFICSGKRKFPPVTHTVSVTEDMEAHAELLPYDQWPGALESESMNVSPKPLLADTLRSRHRVCCVCNMPVMPVANTEQSQLEDKTYCRKHYQDQFNVMWDPVVRSDAPVSSRASYNESVAKTDSKLTQICLEGLDKEDIERAQRAFAKISSYNTGIIARKHLPKMLRRVVRKKAGSLDDLGIATLEHVVDVFMFEEVGKVSEAECLQILAHVCRDIQTEKTRDEQNALLAERALRKDSGAMSSRESLDLVDSNPALAISGRRTSDGWMLY